MENIERAAAYQNKLKEEKERLTRRIDMKQKIETGSSYSNTEPNHLLAKIQSLGIWISKILGTCQIFWVSRPLRELRPIETSWKRKRKGWRNKQDWWKRAMAGTQILSSKMRLKSRKTTSNFLWWSDPNRSSFRGSKGNRTSLRANITLQSRNQEELAHSERSPCHVMGTRERSIESVKVRRLRSGGI